MKRARDLDKLPDLFARWRRREAARREAQTWFKEFFAEAKHAGFNPKALRVAFAEAFREETETTDARQKRETNSADVELYLSALARVRESEPDDDLDFDPETGEILPSAEEVRGILKVPADATQHAADAPEASPDGAGGSASSVPSDGAAATHSEAAAASAAEAQTEAARDGREASPAGREAVESPVPDSETGAASPITPDPQAEGNEAEAAAPATPIRKNWKWTDPAHPDCLDPGTCGGFSNMALCGRCKEAAAALHVA